MRSRGINLDVLTYSFVRRKLTQKLQETEEALSSASQKASNAEKAKNRLNSELEDALIDLEKVSLFSCCNTFFPIFNITFY